MGRGGPKTEAGKSIVRLNAVQHGVLSNTPVIPALEREEDWEAHREGVLAALAPEGQVETALAERVALMLWRLQRVVRFERDAAVMTQEQEEKAYFRRQAKTLADPVSLEDAGYMLESDLRMVRLLEQVSGLPEEATFSDEEETDIVLAIFEAAKVDQGSVDLADVPDSRAHTAGSIREAVKAIASHAGKDPGELLAAALGQAKGEVARQEVEIRMAVEKIERLRRWYLLPDGEVLNKVVRYEAHLNRQLYQALHELEALQARRRGLLAPLARLEVHGLAKG
jgi:hypothetical protein